MATLAEVREAIASTLNAVDVRCEAFATDAPSPPCVLVLPQARRDVSMRATVRQVEIDLNLQLLVPRVSARASQDTLDQLVESVLSALEDSDGLGLTDTSHSLADLVDYGTTSDPAQVTYTAANLTLTVYTTA